MRRMWMVVLVAVAMVASAGATWALNSTYKVNVVLDSATNLVEGGVVQLNGFNAGSIDSIEIRDGKAQVGIDLDSDFAPVHDGAKATVEWKALLGERLLTINDGPATNPTVPSGGMLRGAMPSPMEFDQVLSALDAPTRQHMVGVVNKLNDTISGHEGDANTTIRTAGPALHAIGGVLQSLGTDGPAIKQMVSRVDGLLASMNSRQGDLRTIVDQLSKSSSATVEQRGNLAAALRKTPPALQQATQTLGKVPGTVDKATPLLRDLRPAAEKLPGVTANLQPVLSDLRPMMAQLRPTLQAADSLLDKTPGMLDSAHGVLPGLSSTVHDLLPAVQYLRPYTPEAQGFLSNWGSAGGNYDANGHYQRIYVQQGLASANINPGLVPPGYTKNADPPPGDLAGQPWRDAFGSGVK